MSNEHTGKVFDIEPGEVALCDYSQPPDILCRRTKTVGEVSDGYHTFDELYAHRVELFITLCRVVDDGGFGRCRVWRSVKGAPDGWFLLGLYEERGKQISYHLPIARWGDCSFAEIFDRAPEFDGHTSADVLERLKQL